MDIISISRAHSHCGQWLNLVNQSFKDLDLEQQQQLYEPQKLFSFTQVRGINQKKTDESSFNVQISSSKLKLQGGSFAWYRNRNIPQITVMNRQPKKYQESNYKCYASAFYSAHGQLIETQLNGENFKLSSSSSLSFSCLKFQTTSYILRPSKSSVFSPFMPICLKRAVGDEESDEDQNVFRTLDTTEGFSDYFKGSTIKQKICHPIFVAIAFPKTVKLHIPNKLFPSSNLKISSQQYCMELLLNVQGYFLDTLSSTTQSEHKKIILEVKESPSNLLKDKVKCFLRSIYSGCLDLDTTLHQKGDSSYEGLSQISFENSPTSHWIQAYKESFFDMEMMFLKMKMTKQQLNKQAECYSQKQQPKLEENSHSYHARNFFSIPSTEISLNRTNYEDSHMESIPICRQTVELHQISKKQLKLSQKKISVKNHSPELSHDSKSPATEKKLKKNNEILKQSENAHQALGNKVISVPDQPSKYQRLFSSSESDNLEEHSFSTKQIEKSFQNMIPSNNLCSSQGNSPQSEVVSPIVQNNQTNIISKNNLGLLFNCPESSSYLNSNSQLGQQQLPQLILSQSSNSPILSAPLLNPLNSSNSQNQFLFGMNVQQQQQLLLEQQLGRIPNYFNFTFNIVPQQQLFPQFTTQLQQQSLQPNGILREILFPQISPSQFS